MQDFLEADASSRMSIRPGWVMGLLILCMVSMVAAFVYSALQASNNSRYLTIVGDQKMHVLQLVKQAAEATQSKSTAFTQLEDTRDELDTLFNRLQQGETETGLPPSPQSTAPELDAAVQTWGEFRTEVNVVLKSEGVIRLMNELVVAINEIMPDLISFSDRVVQGLISTNADKQQIYIAGRQLMLGQRIATNVNRLMLDTNLSKDAAQAFTEDTRAFGKVLNGFINGDNKLKIDKVRSANIREQLDQLNLIHETVEQLIARILEKSRELFRAQQAANKLFEQSGPFLISLDKLTASYQHREQQRDLVSWLGYGLGAASLALLVMLGVALTQSTRKQLVTEASTNRRTQDAILRLLDEIAPVAEGDLTVKATVTEEITGAIADAINYTVDALRNLVTSINRMAAEVATTAEETQVTAIHLTRASDQQAKQIEAVTSHVVKMAHGVLNLSKQAQQSSELAGNAVDIAEQGAVAVRNTIKGMHAIRDDIKISASRIKQLGESSQEIGDIIELINDIADQTNILALNAAIQASAVSSDSFGFTSVADEVQQLAERVGLSTQKIESLIMTIQADTAKAVDAMEESTGDVLEGARLAEGAGNALLRIESVSAHLADFIQKVSEAAVELTHTAEQVTSAMKTIKNVTQQNVAGTKQTALLTGKLAKLAKEQQQTVKEFKLPAHGGGKPA